MNSKTISPHRSSRAVGEKDSGSEELGNNVKTNIGMDDIKTMSNECMPIEEDEEAAEEDHVTEAPVKI